MDDRTGTTVGSLSRQIPSPPLEKFSGVIAVIPAYNEELSIGSIVLKARQIVERVIVVDDGSTDRTAEVARMAGAEVIGLPENKGKANALLTGLKHARDFGCRAAVVIDGDARYKTREIPWVVSHIINASADLVIGSRYLEMGGNLPVRQQLKQKMYSQNVQNNPLVVLTDPLSGFFAVSCKALHQVEFNFEEADPNQHLISQILAQHLTVREVAVTERPNIQPRLDWDYSNKVVAALPAYNEERTLPKIIHAAKQYVDAVIVVDDGSMDATAAVARDAGAIVIQHNTNIGYGAALQTIFATARNIEAEALVILDSDGQHNPDDIEKLLKPLLSGADVVIGSRFLTKTKTQIPSYRKAGMKVLDTATAAAGVKNVTDTQSGFRAYNKKAIDAITINTSGMSAGSEILIQASDANLHISEVPITASYNPSTQSTHNPVSHGIEVLGRIIALISYRRPLPAFGIPGLILFVIGVAWGIFAIYNYEVSKIVSIPLSILSGVFMFLGLAMGIAGLILNAIINIRVENRDKKN